MRVHALVGSEAEAIAAVAAGATVVQVRLKHARTPERTALGTRLRRLPVTLVMNDDVDAALGCGADGVHLGQSDGGAEAALAAGLLVGISVATAAQAHAAERLGASYVGAGPVWPTPTKPDAGPSIGLAGLASITAAVGIPVVAIGGIDHENAARCIASGAAGVAVVRAASDPRLRAVVDSALDTLVVS